MCGQTEATETSCNLLGPLLFCDYIGWYNMYSSVIR